MSDERTYIGFNCSKGERAAVEALAEKRGETMTEVVRRAVRVEARLHGVTVGKEIEIDDDEE